MTEDNRKFDEADAQLLPKLAAALKRLPRDEVFVPRYVDDAIFKAARRHLQKSAKSRPVKLPRWFWWPAFTSAVVVVSFAFVLFHQHEPRSAREDLNHDGRVDILDAFALAKELQRGALTAPKCDFNGDGVVDERDTEILAARAVQLEKGGRS